MNENMELHRRVNRLGTRLGIPQDFNQEFEETSTLLRRLDRYIETVDDLVKNIKGLLGGSV